MFCILKLIKHLQRPTEVLELGRSVGIDPNRPLPKELYLSSSLLVMVAVKQRVLEDTSWWLERKFGSKALPQSKSVYLKCSEVGNSPSHSDSTVPGQALQCVVISLR